MIVALSFIRHIVRWVQIVVYKFRVMHMTNTCFYFTQKPVHLGLFAKFHSNLRSGY